MIFSLHYFLIMAGYSACGLLLGSYMILYTGANELELGFIFMIQPLAAFARPFICARADRLQSHKSLLLMCLLSNVLFYLPFIAIPLLLGKLPELGEDLLNKRVCFWILAVSHLIGSFGFCGVRSLGDSLAVNHAKRVNSHFGSYRKFGAIGFGLCGFLLGQINQDWWLPDFVPSFIVYVLSMFTLMVLVYLWPDEYFTMVAQTSSARHDHHQQQLQDLPRGQEVAARMWTKLIDLVLCRSQAISRSPLADDGIQAASKSSARQTKSSKCHSLSTRQQTQIFLLLIKRDFRIPLFLLLLLWGGLVGYAPQNFVFTYMVQVCHVGDTCNGAFLAGLMMMCYCIMETLCYLIINALRSRLNYLVMLEITLVSLAFHYYFYGFLLAYLSPYFFLIESLHGLEYSISLTSGVELAHRFASEVELLLPELIQRRIISKEDDTELVKLSLMATMNSCFTLVYDGAGTIIGAFLYGIILENYSFTVVWRVIGTMATIGFVVALVVYCIGRYIGMKPQILRCNKTIPKDPLQNTDN